MDNLRKQVSNLHYMTNIKNKKVNKTKNTFSLSGENNIQLLLLLLTYRRWAANLQLKDKWTQKDINGHE